MRDVDKIHHMDGLPGITLPGITGSTGERGACNIVIELSDEGNIMIGENLFEIKCAPDGYYPKPNDMMSAIFAGETILYIVNSVSISEGLYTCDCTRLNSLTSDGVSGDSESSESEISIDLTGTNIQYQYWDGYSTSTIVNSSGIISGARAATSQKSLSLIGFKIYTNDGNLPACKIDIEFIAYTIANGTKFQISPMSYNRMAELLADSSTYDASTNPRGGWEDYTFSNEVNFDDETLGNFTVTVKDWNEGTSSKSMDSKKVIPNYIGTGIIRDDLEILYSARILVSTKKSNVITRMCIGSIDDVRDLFS